MTEIPDRISKLTPEARRALLRELLGQRTDALPLSYGQRSLWLLNQLDPSSVAYNISVTWTVRSALDFEALRRTIQVIVDRHAALRTIFSSRNGEPFQQIAAKVSADFEMVDASGMSEAEFRERVIEEIHQPLDLVRGPLFKARLFRSAERDILLFVFHHIVYDLRSLMVLVNEIAVIYPAECLGKQAALPPRPYDYPDYVRWQLEMVDTPVGRADWDYWRRQLRDCTLSLSLPTDRPRQTTPARQGASLTVLFDTSVTQDLRRFVRAEGVTLFSALLAVYSIVLYRWTGQTDIVAGSPTAGRTRPEFEDLFGYCLNTVPLRVKVSDGITAQALVQQVQAMVREALEHQEFPAELMMERLRTARRPGGAALFDTLFVLNRPHHLDERAAALSADPGEALRLNLGGLVLEPFPVEHHTAMVDLALTMVELGESLIASWQYRTDLFDRSTIGSISGSFMQVLREVIRDPGQRISTLPLVAETDASHVMLRGTAAPPMESHSLIVPKFERQVRETPQRAAVVTTGDAWTYAELNCRADRLARHLRTRGARPDTCVLLCLHRSPELIAAMLGVLKSGAAYVPVDPGWPPGRIAEVIQSCRPFVMLCEGSTRSLLPETGTPVLEVETACNIDPPADSAPVAAPLPGGLAYVIYTSGSTGQPKGVMISHAALAVFAQSAGGYMSLTPGDRVLQFASASFDAAVEEIYPTLISGATLLLRTDDVLASAALLFERCREWGITVLDLPTGYWHHVVDEISHQPVEFPHSLRLVILGGEAARADCVAAWHRCGGSRVRLLNTYGPTETTVVCTTQDLTDWRAAEDPPIGRPIPGALAVVLDRNGQLLPQGAIGELCVGGAGLARGYLGVPELTAERFAPNPWGVEPGERLYHTGDLVRIQADGALRFLGRADSQVKVRGFRVEPGEIEAVLRSTPGVRDAAIALKEIRPGDARLVGYWVAGSSDADVTDIRAFLENRLPDYMLPLLIQVEQLPMMSSGKVDRAALPDPSEIAASPTNEYVAPETHMEKAIAAIWLEVLGVPRVGLHDNFFELGGHSLLGAQVVGRIRERHGINLPLRRVFEAPTVARLAREVDRTPDSGPSKSEPREEIRL